MKLLRETIRKLIQEAMSDNILDFLGSLDSEYDHLRTNQYGTDIFDFKWTDSCRVEFGIAITENQEVHIKYIETIGDDCLRKGYASRSMKHLLFILDTYNLSAILEVESFGDTGMEEDDLSQWYKSMGFKYVRDADGFDGMRRDPQ